MARRNFKNRTLYQGDNLDFLRAMNSETIDLIATDPPFNKSRDFHATPNSLAKGARFQDRWKWQRDVQQEWVDQITDDYPALKEAIEAARAAHSDGMGAFLCFLAVRLIEMQRILKADGSIYLHCDPTASHYIKMAMDTVFGRQCFKNEIIWCYTGPSNTTRFFKRKHDVILFYAKGEEWTFNGDDIRVPYKRLETGQTSGIFKQAATLDSKGKIPETWWPDFTPVGRLSGERTGYPTQKPLALYERIIRASSDKGDWVLDPFSGCATTLIAAEKLKRKWVGMDLWRGAKDLVVERLTRDGILTPPSGKPQDLFPQGTLFYEKTPPKRSAKDMAEDPPLFRVPVKFQEPGRRMSRQDMLDELVGQYGCVCQGCDRKFDGPRYLQLDHNTPRSSGGLNHISNRVLLCGPCNNLKSNIYTLEGLRRENKKRGFMARHKR